MVNAVRLSKGSDENLPRHTLILVTPRSGELFNKACHCVLTLYTAVMFALPIDVKECARERESNKKSKVYNTKSFDSINHPRTHYYCTIAFPRRKSNIAEAILKNREQSHCLLLWPDTSHAAQIRGIKQKNRLRSKEAGFQQLQNRICTYHKRVKNMVASRLNTSRRYEMR